MFLKFCWQRNFWTGSLSGWIASASHLRGITLLCSFRMLFRLGATKWSSAPETPSLLSLSFQRLCHCGGYHFVLTINLKLRTRLTPCPKSSAVALDHRVDSFKTIIWLHNLTISHLETDYCHSSDTPFSLLYSDFQLSGICYDSSPDLHPRRPTEAEQVFSFSVVTILVSMSAEFRLVCIFISDNTSFKRMRMKWYLTSMCLVLSW